MEPRLELCPRCGSHEIGTDRIPHMGQQHTCPDCGYEGSFVIEADSPEDAQRIQEELQADLEAEAQLEDEDGDEPGDA
jgi:predicted nucleic-acid-binding Zn-ribbon protein